MTPYRNADTQSADPRLDLDRGLQLADTGKVAGGEQLDLMSLDEDVWGCLVPHRLVVDRDAAFEIIAARLVRLGFRHSCPHCSRHSRGIKTGRPRPQKAPSRGSRID
jgi:hypothetical protein